MISGHQKVKENGIILPGYGSLQRKKLLAVLHELRRIFKDCGRFVWPCERDLVQIYVS